MNHGLPAIPALLHALAPRHVEGERGYETVRWVTSTGAALASADLERLRLLFPKARVFSTYGLTECERCTYLSSEDLERKPDSVGRPIPNTEAWIVDDDGQQVGPNTVGELVIRGAIVMSGYWGQPGATADRLRSGPLPGERVLYTGDLCSMDEDGYINVVGCRDPERGPARAAARGMP